MFMLICGIQLFQASSDHHFAIMTINPIPITVTTIMDSRTEKQTAAGEPWARHEKFGFLDGRISIPRREKYV